MKKLIVITFSLFTLSALANPGAPSSGGPGGPPKEQCCCKVAGRTVHLKPLPCTGVKDQNNSGWNIILVTPGTCNIGTAPTHQYPGCMAGQAQGPGAN